jgi:hypothetical protein
MPWFRCVAFCRVARLLPLLAILLLCTSCSGFFVSNSSTASITVNPTSLLLKTAASATSPGDSYMLSASATTVGGTISDETSAAAWTSSNPTVVAVSQGNLSVVGTAAGSTAVITATFGGQSATCNVLTYTGAAPTTLVVNFPTTISPSVIAPGTIFQVTATAALSGINTDISKYVAWSSNATSIATVDVNGNVTVIGTPGTFTITAIATFASTTVQGTSTTFTVI